jgi:putative transposase
VVADCPHHVTQRGNNRQDVFFLDEDRRYYLQTLREQAGRQGVKIEAYCLMTNHVHLVATPRTAEALAAMMRRVNQFYTQYVNRLHGRCGHLWQDRFFSCPLDGEHFWAAMIYVERNPVRARLAPLAWDYHWSSAAAHCGQADPAAMLDLAAWRTFTQGQDWRESLHLMEDEQTASRLRLCTSRGRPLGSDSFVANLECTIGRRLRPLPEGRPKKKRTDHMAKEGRSM